MPYRRAIRLENPLRLPVNSPCVHFLSHKGLGLSQQAKMPALLQEQRGHFSQMGTHLLCLLSSCFTPQTPISLTFRFLPAVDNLCTSRTIFCPIAACRKGGFAKGATL